MTSSLGRITGSAFLTTSGVLISLPAPARHHDIILHMRDAGYSREEIARSEQGFVTDGGDWADRELAKKIAQDAGQIIRDSSGGNPKLFSEDVW